MILIVTHSTDVTADLVIRHLHRLRAQYIRLDTDTLGTSACHFGFDESGPWLAMNDRLWSPGDFQSVWYRRFALPRVLERVEPSTRLFVQRELSTIMEAFFATITGRQMNSLEADRRAGNRLLQALVARRVGLEIPVTLVTQQESRARQFLLEHEGGITKAISFGLIEESGRVAFTTQVDGDSDLTGIDICPSLFQKRVSVAHEWRVTIVGKQVFAARTRLEIHHTLDWRRLPDQCAIFEAATLPSKIEVALMKLMRESGLVFGAHDLIETPDRKFVFLETNPAGQWGWLEVSLGLPIGESVATFLLGSQGSRDVIESP